MMKCNAAEQRAIERAMPGMSPVHGNGATDPPRLWVRARAGSLRVLFLLLVVSGCCSSLPKLVDRSRVVEAHQTTYVPVPVSHPILESSVVWHDAKRDRDVPVKIYLPAGVANPPLVIFSHGIGEDRDSYSWLGRALAGRGYAAIHLTHTGTDKAKLAQGYLKLYRATKKRENWVNRPLDVSFVIDQLAAHASSAPRVDLDHVAVAGHSAGAFTVLALAGMTMGSGQSLADSRVRVGVAMSMPKMEGIVPANGYNGIAIPILHMTGTCDSSLIYRTRPADRRAPFESTSAKEQYLITIDGVNHNTFSNAADVHHEQIARTTAAYLDAFLRGDGPARAWFDQGGVVAGERGMLALEKK